jgi:hypothetical protein
MAHTTQNILMRYDKIHQKDCRVKKVPGIYFLMLISCLICSRLDFKVILKNRYPNISTLIVSVPHPYF